MKLLRYFFKYFLYIESQAPSSKVYLWRHGCSVGVGVDVGVDVDVGGDVGVCVCVGVDVGVIFIKVGVGGDVSVCFWS